MILKKDDELVILLNERQIGRWVCPKDGIDIHDKIYVWTVKGIGIDLRKQDNDID